jgi:hypothetical protein
VDSEGFLTVPDATVVVILRPETFFARRFQQQALHRILVFQLSCIFISFFKLATWPELLEVFVQLPKYVGSRIMNSVSETIVVQSSAVLLQCRRYEKVRDHEAHNTLN